MGRNHPDRYYSTHLTKKLEECIGQLHLLLGSETRERHFTELEPLEKGRRALGKRDM